MYTDQTRVEAYLQRELSDNEAVLLQPTIEFVSKLIDTYTTRHWSSCNEDDTVATPTTKYFDGDGAQELYIDEFSDLQSVTLLDRLGVESIVIDDPTLYQTFPNNADVFNSILLRGYRFPIGRGNVKVIANFNGAIVPDGVIIIATAMTCNILNTSNSSRFKSESIEGYSYINVTPEQYTDQNKELLAGLDIYKRILL